jgi:predicted transcriptional regulator of viral defense system
MAKIELIEKLARELGIVSIKDLRKNGVHPEQMRRLVQSGKMTRIERGLYRLADQNGDFYNSFAIVAKAQPEAVICLSSALFYHHIGTQMPHEVWIALPRGRFRAPRLKILSLRVFRYSGKTLKSGIDEVSISGVKVKITSPARTVADCFKFRNNTGLDVALEALREGWRGKHFTIDELTAQSRICRVERIMAPYVEAMVVS